MLVLRLSKSALKSNCQVQVQRLRESGRNFSRGNPPLVCGFELFFRLLHRVHRVLIQCLYLRASALETCTKIGLPGAKAAPTGVKEIFREEKYR